MTRFNLMLVAAGALCLAGPAAAQQANMTFFITSTNPGKGANFGGIQVLSPGVQKNLRGNDLPQAPTVKASAGATEHLLLVPVDDLASTLTDLHLRGLRIVGSDADAALTAREADLRGPIAIVVGSEGHGLSPAVRRRCDLFVRLPMRGAIGSLNAAVAGSVLLFEVVGQRDAGPRPGGAPSSDGTVPEAADVTGEPQAEPPAKVRKAPGPRAAKAPAPDAAEATSTTPAKTAKTRATKPATKAEAPEPKPAKTAPATPAKPSAKRKPAARNQDG